MPSFIQKLPAILAGMVKKNIGVTGKTHYTQKEPERYCPVILCYTTLADMLCLEWAAVN